MPAVNPSAGRATAAVIAAAALFGTTGTSQALGPDATTPLGLGTLRIAIGAVTLWVLAGPAVASLRRLDRRSLLILVVGGVGVAAYQPTFLAGTSRSGVALATAVALGSGPVFAGLIELVRTRRPPPASWTTATAVTIAGGALLVTAGGSDTRFDAVGLMCSLLAGASYAVYAATTKRLIMGGVESTSALAGSFTIGTLLLALVALGEPFGWVASAGGFALLAHLGVVTVGVAYWLYGYGLRHLPVPRAVTLTLAEPLTAAVLGVVVLGEHLVPLGWLGIVLVLAGLVLAARGPRPAPSVVVAPSVASAA